MQPTQMGPYAFGARLGRGGMGAVYEATDTGTGTTVAVKVLSSHLADDSGLRKRFTAEIDTLKSLRHPGIVQLLAFGEEDGQPYFAMELVRGQSLEQILRSGRRFTWRETVAAALAIARALKVAHDHGIIHRDLKPANLLIAMPDAAVEGDAAATAAEAIDDQALAAVKLADFGIAKLFGAAGHTAHGSIVGTAEYMAPEQAAGKPVDHRVDLYALGLVMFAMLAGRPPFIGKQALEVIEKQRREPPRRVSTVVADVPAELDALIDRLLAKDPANRPANALALGRLLTAIDTLHAPTNKPDTTAPAPAAHSSVTAHERSQRPTVATPDPAAARPDQSVDLLAATRGFTGRLAAEPTHPMSQRAPHAGTAVSAESRTAGADTIVDRSTRNRFTTVEELDRAARTQADRDRAAQRRWQIVTACATLAALGLGGYWLIQPPTADQLYDRIKAIEVAADADANAADLRDARPAIAAFLTRHADDPRAAEIQALDRTLDLDALEKRARRRVVGTRVLSPIERDYRAALDREADSPSACRDAFEALLALHPTTADKKPVADEEALWLALVRRQIERLRPLATREQAEDGRRLATILAEADTLAAKAAATPNPSQKAELTKKRRTLLEGLIELYSSRPHAAPAVATAKQKLEQ